MDIVYQPGWRRTIRLRGFIITSGIALLGACNNSTEVTRSIASRKPTASFAASPSALHASAVSFDLIAETTHPGAAARTMRAHVERVAGVGGWRTTITLIDDPRVAKLPAAPWRPRRFVVDEAGRLTVYRDDGQVARKPDLSQLPRPSIAVSSVSTPNSNGITIQTDWIDELLVGSSARASASAAIIAGAVLGGRDAQGLDHYIKSGAALRRDISVDPASGIVRGVVLSDGVRTSRAAFEYVNTPSGLSVRTRSHFEQAGGKFAGSHTITIQNVVVDGSEVTP